MHVCIDVARVLPGNHVIATDHLHRLHERAWRGEREEDDKMIVTKASEQFFRHDA
jgi:hypothetical protein